MEKKIIDKGITVLVTGAIIAAGYLMVDYLKTAIAKGRDDENTTPREPEKSAAEGFQEAREFFAECDKEWEVRREQGADEQEAAEKTTERPCSAFVALEHGPDGFEAKFVHYTRGISPELDKFVTEDGRIRLDQICEQYDNREEVVKALIRRGFMVIESEVGEDEATEAPNGAV